MNFKRIAHRGFSSEAPENSRAAFALAVEGDFYGVECDIWKSADGVYVVSHDGHMERMCGVDEEIPKLPYEKIASYPFVRGKKRTNHPEQHLIRFTEYLSIMARNDHMHPVVELKVDFTTVELGEIVDLVRKYGLCERTYFISMHQQALLRLKNEWKVPPERLQYVYGAERKNKWIPVNLELEQWLIENRINLDSRHSLITEGTVIRLHQAGLQVNVWTVNDKKLTEKMLKKLKVDMITTEYYHEID